MSGHAAPGLPDGYALRALQEADAPELHVEIRADVENRPSCAVAERLGFQFEGVLR